MGRSRCGTFMGVLSHSLFIRLIGSLISCNQVIPYILGEKIAKQRRFDNRRLVQILQQSIILALLVFPTLLWGHTDGLGLHAVTAYRLEDIPPPTIDGRLDDLAWNAATPISGFVQLEPRRGEPATDDTIAYIVYDRHNLYVAFRCYDSEPDKIVSRITRRGNIYDSDLISFFIDPYHDHRTGYKFGTTPSGIQEDNYRYDDTQIDGSWRGIWWVESRIDELGWAAEFKIPFANFRFPESTEQVWGFDVERLNRRKSEITIWKQMTQAGYRTRMSDLGHLVGLSGIETGKSVEIIPYALGGTSTNHRQSVSGQLGAGIDLQYSMSGALKTNFTLNPDFAQVEADQLEINLTRFPTRFPEKRPFFVEGNSFFETPIALFFSRRIGDRGDILWGGKMTGKVNRYSIGLLGAQTGNFNVLEVGQPPRSKEKAWYSAVRVKRDVLNRSNIGALFTNREHGTGYSRVIGADMSLALGKTYHATGQIAQSFHSEGNAVGNAYILKFVRRNYVWDIKAELERIGPRFETNQTGFLEKESHRGWQRLDWEATYSARTNARWRPFFGAGSGISQTLYTNDYFLHWQRRHPTLDLADGFTENLIGWDVKLIGGTTFTESFLSRIRAVYERSREIELTDIFGANYFAISIDTNRAKPIAGWFRIDIADYYNFDRQSVGLQRGAALASTLRPRSNFTLDLIGSYAHSLNSQRAIDGRFLVGSLRATYLFTRNAFLRVFTQAARGRSTFERIQLTEDYLVSLLFGWEYNPKSNFFVGYNEGWQTDGEHLRLANRVVVFKLGYLWNR